jgi:hypothetical protein
VRGRLPEPTTIQLETQAPRLAVGQPVVLPLPDSSLGPHLSYAIQWFSFTAMTLVFWPLLIRRSARQREKAARIAVGGGGSGTDEGSPAVEPGPGLLELGGQAEQDRLLAEPAGELHADR